MTTPLGIKQVLEDARCAFYSEGHKDFVPFLKTSPDIYTLQMFCPEYLKFFSDYLKEDPRLLYSKVYLQDLDIQDILWKYFPEVLVNQYSFILDKIIGLDSPEYSKKKCIALSSVLRGRKEFVVDLDQDWWCKRSYSVEEDAFLDSNRIGSDELAQELCFEDAYFRYCAMSHEARESFLKFLSADTLLSLINLKSLRSGYYQAFFRYNQRNKALVPTNWLDEFGEISHHLSWDQNHNSKYKGYGLNRKSLLIKKV